jgi:CubicO group peptidase (beta-lactamase class C family)
MPLAVTLSQAATASGYGRDDPLVIAVGRAGRRPAHLARGCFPAGSSAVIACSADPGRGGPTISTLIYVASLAKQVVAACAALLVRDGVLDVEAPVGDRLTGAEVRVRHLIHHTSGLREGRPPSGDRTSDGMLAAIDGLEFAAGTRQSYSNVGYVVLAEVISRAAGMPLADFARRRIFEPLGMTDTMFWSGPEPAPPGAAPLDPVHPAPLSIGDGGLWSTAADLLRWADALNADRLGVTDLVQTPGTLDDGTPLDYAWGMGIRTRFGHRVYQHGGGWADVRTMLVRVPEKGLDLVILALADRSERSTVLTGKLLEALPSGRVRPGVTHGAGA